MMNGAKYFWTKHSQYKMRHYGLSPQRIKRIIRYPARIEEVVGKVKKQLGWKPKVKFEEIVNLMVEADLKEVSKK